MGVGRRLRLHVEELQPKPAVAVPFGAQVGDGDGPRPGSGEAVEGEHSILGHDGREAGRAAGRAGVHRHVHIRGGCRAGSDGRPTFFVWGGGREQV